MVSSTMVAWGKQCKYSRIWARSECTPAALLYAMAKARHYHGSHNLISKHCSLCAVYSHLQPATACDGGLAKCFNLKLR